MTKRTGKLKAKQKANQNLKGSHPLYNLYYSIKARCHNSADPRYKDYGLRGISMCDLWLNNKSAFLEWALANGYKQGLHIDRINNNDNYEPNNCHFITLKENNNNKRNNVMVKLDGVLMNATQAAALLNKEKKYVLRIAAGRKNPIPERLIIEN